MEVGDRDPQVWVQPYPIVETGEAVPVSSEGAIDPVWSRDGSELFMCGAGGHTLWVAAVPPPGEKWEPPEQLFDIKYRLGGAPWAHQYAVAPDGRFLFVQRLPGRGSE